MNAKQFQELLKESKNILQEGYFNKDESPGYFNRPPGYFNKSKEDGKEELSKHREKKDLGKEARRGLEAFDLDDEAKAKQEEDSSESNDSSSMEDIESLLDDMLKSANEIVERIKDCQAAVQGDDGEFINKELSDLHTVVSGATGDLKGAAEDIIRKRLQWLIADRVRQNGGT